MTDRKKALDAAREAGIGWIADLLEGHQNLARKANDAIERGDLVEADQALDEMDALTAASIPEAATSKAKVTPQPAASPNYRELAKQGLHVAPEILRVRKEQIIRFETPCRLNNLPLFLATSFEMGAYSYIRGGIVRAVKSIGRYTSIGPNVMIGETEHPTDWVSTSPAFYFADQFAFTPREKELAPLRTAWHGGTKPKPMGKVTIGNDVWIGGNVIIRQGVNIGDGAVIGAGAIVLNDVEPYSIVMGLPAKKKRFRFADLGVIEALKKSRWWEFDANSLVGLPYEHPGAFVDQLMGKEAKGEIARRPKTFAKVSISTAGYRFIKD
ncbi:CatB-related O-acetyltransferase [Shinella sp. M27]|uniref:CatB-related O-acetyltransferase n=1 Tax=Shinella sp. M27 TaxID=3368614 RepID=UPI003BA1A3E7